MRLPSKKSAAAEAIPLDCCYPRTEENLRHSARVTKFLERKPQQVYPLRLRRSRAGALLNNGSAMRFSSCICISQQRNRLVLFAVVAHTSVSQAARVGGHNG